VTVRAFLDLPDGMAVVIGVDGLLVGRHRSCDIQLTAETASRRHALLRATRDGVELVVLGGKPVERNGTPCTSACDLADGDHVRLPGFEGRVRIERREDSVPVAHAVRRRRERFQIRSSPFIIGTGPAARVVIAGWPAEAMRFSSVDDALIIELAEPGGTLNGTELAAHAPTAVTVGDAIGYRGDMFTIEQADAGESSTVLVPAATAPTAVVLRPLPRGGRITFSYPGGDRTVYVPGRRYQLLAALLATAGDFVVDADLIPRVWNDNDEVGGRQDVNVLLTRCRQDLVAAGIQATTLLERAPGGRATRIVLAPGAVVRTTTD
jgi:hypothetical protein